MLLPLVASIRGPLLLLWVTLDWSARMIERMLDKAPGLDR